MIENIVNRFVRHDFSGNTGQAIKNSSFQLATSLIAKLGSLFFTIILARLLMPEVFGLYSLALSTIILFATFSDLGIGAALITFVSKNLGMKKESKAKGYFSYLLKWKFALLFSSSLLLISLSYFIANYYYHKPIFLALLAGSLYVFFVNLMGFFEQTFQASNLFKYVLYKEILFQILRFILIPLGILFFLSRNISTSFLVAFILILISFCYFVLFIYLFFLSKKKINFISLKPSQMNKKERLELKNFVLPLTATSLSGIFFGYIDIIMIGHFVAEEFIAYYGAAFNLINAATAIIGFTAPALLPIFSRLKGRVLEGNFRKIRAATAVIGVLGFIFTLFVVKYIVFLVYGTTYENSILLLQLFSLLMIFLPLSALYNNYFISQEKTKILAYLLIGTTILNIILNYFFITQGLKTGMYQAVIGACIATIISRFVYLGSLGFVKRFSF